MFDMDIQTMFSLAVIFVISISMHEYAHALTSYKLWDNLPEMQWRLTPNPLVHIDPIGFLAIFLIHFGWGRPVQINPANYKNPLRDELLVSLAWPFSNILMALVASFTLALFVRFGMINDILANFFQMFIFINIALAVFNMIPIPPLDGYRIIKFLKPEYGYFMEKNMMYFSIWLLILIFMPGNILGYFIQATVLPIFEFFIRIAGLVVGVNFY